MRRRDYRFITPFRSPRCAWRTNEVPKTFNGNMVYRERLWIANDPGDVRSPTDAQGDVLRELTGKMPPPIIIILIPEGSIVLL